MVVRHWDQPLTPCVSQVETQAVARQLAALTGASQPRPGTTLAVLGQLYHADQLSTAPVLEDFAQYARRSVTTYTTDAALSVLPVSGAVYPRCLVPWPLSRDPTEVPQARGGYVRIVGLLCAVVGPSAVGISSVLPTPTPPVSCPAFTATMSRILRVDATQLLAQWLWQPEGEPGRRYLQTRGIDESTATTFRLGSYPDHPTALLRALATRGVTMAEAAALGLAIRGNGQWRSGLRGRVIFSIMDRCGQVRGFGARALSDRSPKYLNSPDSPLFHKGHLLYGLAQAHAAIQMRGEAVIVEGYCDVLALHQAGLTATVSPLSTTLSTSQLSLLCPLVSRVVVLFDGDPAGQAAMTRVFVPAEESGVPVAVVTLLRAHDPDSYVRTHGGPALAALAALASSLGEYMVRQLAAQYPQERAGREVVTLAERITHPVRQLFFLQQAETCLQFPPGSLSEVMGLGHASRHRLEEIVAELVLTIPEVQARLRGVTVPLRDPRLRAVVARAPRGVLRPACRSRSPSRADRDVGWRDGFSLSSISPLPVDHIE